MQTLPLILRMFCSYGCYGVNVFFVLSGFVIAHSLRQMSTKQDFAKFILRRQLRLDPPYWCVLGLCVLAVIVQNHLPGLQPEKPYSASDIAFNLLYLQRIVKVGDIVGGSWTLCLEIQFYLLYASMLLCGQFLQRFRGFSNFDLCVSGLVTAVAFLSLYRSFVGNTGAWFTDYWFYFASGVLCYRVFAGTTPPAFFFATVGLIFLGGTVSAEGTITVPFLTTVITALAIYAACRMNKLGTWLAHPIFQYFGRISYSLYLVNILTAWTVLRIGYKVSGDNSAASILWFAVAAGFSVIAANALYLFAEKPSLAFSEKVKKRLWQKA